MAIATASELASQIRRLRLLEPQQLEALDALQAQFPEPLALARTLIGRDWLTPYQVNLIFNGRGEELLVGSYILLERLGEGGMGFVYKARNWKIGRVVALKIIRQEKFDQVESLERFRREVQLAARLSHPNVVVAFDADESEGSIYYAMEYVEGLDLCKLVQQRGPLPFATACECIRQAAMGLQHAYQLGLVHRDIKPNNLMVEGASSRKDEPFPASFTVKILDFGLARPHVRADQKEELRLTQLGKVVGTPDFLAPEQARDSARVDIRADLYSLGCTCYFLLTGEAPFPEGTTIEKLMQHQLEEPIPLEQRRPDIPATLVALVRKLMAKRPEDRYQTPAEVILAIQDFLLNSPGKSGTPRRLVRSAPPGIPGPAPVVPTAVGTALAAKPTLTGGGPADRAPEPDDSETAVESSPATPPLRRRVPAPEEQPGSPSPPASPARGRRWLALVAVLVLAAGLVLFFRPGPSSPSSSEPTSPAPRRSLLDNFDPAYIPTAQRLAGLPAEVVAVLGDQRLQHGAWVRQVALSPDGRLIASVGLDHALVVWDAATGRQKAVLSVAGQLFHALAFTEGKPRVRYVVGMPASVFEWDLASSKPSGLLSGDDCGTFLALSPDGRFLAHRKKPTEPVEVRNLDERTSREVAIEGTVQRAALAGDGSRLAIAEGRTVRWWDLVQPAVEGPAVTLDAEATSLALALSRDGALLAVAAFQRNDRITAVEVKLWRLDSAKVQARGRFRVKGPQVAGVAFSGDGKILAVAHNLGQAGGVALWDVTRERESGALATEGAVAAVAFARDRPLLVAGADHSVRLWDATTAKDQLSWSRPRAPVAALYPTPDAKRVVLVRGLFEQSVSLWDLARDREVPIASGLRPGVHVRLAGGRLLAVGHRERITLWSLEGELLEHARLSAETANPIQGWSMTPDGSLLLTTYARDPDIHVWEVPRSPRKDLPRAARNLSGHKTAPTIIVAAPNSQLLASASADGLVKVWDVSTLSERYSLTHAAGAPVALAFSPDSQTLATVTRENGVRLWTAATGKPEQSFKGEIPLVPQVQFSPNGKQLLLTSALGLRVWDLAAKKDRLNHSSRVLLRSAVFAPNSQFLAAAEDDQDLRLWRSGSGTPRELHFPGPIHALRFAPDGRHLFTGNGNGSVYLLRLGEPE
jgi:serine/threonine-protein kinase